MPSFFDEPTPTTIRYLAVQAWMYWRNYAHCMFRRCYWLDDE